MTPVDEMGVPRRGPTELDNQVPAARYTERDLFNAFLAGYDSGQDDAKDDNYAIKPILRDTFRRVRSDYEL